MHALSDFRPPLPSQLVISLCQFFFPIYTRLIDPLRFEFDGSSVESLRFLDDQPTVILINHPDKQDPLILMAISRYLRNASFYCVVAREVFDWKHGWLGWLFQRLGCYSVDRGTTDFKSIQTTLKILCRQNRKLVVFPEGEVTGDEDFVHHINPALMHVLLKAEADVGKNSEKTIWLLPIGIRYRLETTLEKSIGRTVRRLEQALNAKFARKATLEDRVQTVMQCTLDKLAVHYDFIRPIDCAIAEEVTLLARHICERVASLVSEGKRESTASESVEQLLHRLRTELTKKIDSMRPVSAYDRGLQKVRSQIYREFIVDLDRVERLVIFQRVLSRHPSPINTCRIVDFLESELCGRMTPKGRQIVSIYVGKPIDLGSLHYERLPSKHLAAEQLSTNIQDELQSVLTQARKKAH